MNADALQTLAADVAANLGDGWSLADPSYDHIAKIADGDRTLILRPMTYGAGMGRIEIAGAYPNDAMRVISTHGISFPKITVAGDRPAKVIAREIERRLLPDYAGTLAEILSRHEAHLAYESAKRVGVAAIAHILGVDAHDDGTIYTPSAFAGYGKFTVYRDTVNIDLSSVPSALAEQIACLIALSTEPAK